MRLFLEVEDATGDQRIEDVRELAVAPLHEVIRTLPPDGGLQALPAKRRRTMWRFLSWLASPHVPVNSPIFVAAP